MLRWFADQWPDDLGPLLTAISRDAEAHVLVRDEDGFTTVEIAFEEAPSTLPPMSPYEGEATWDVAGLTGEAILFSSRDGVMLEIIWHDGWPGRCPRPDELRPASRHS